MASFPQAIVFDFDGVLCDSVAVKTRAFAQLYQSAGLEIVNQIVAYHEANGGVSRFDKFRYFEGTLLGRRVTAARIRRLSQRFSHLVEQAVIAAPYIPGALEFLRDHIGIVPMFVVSGTPDEELRRILIQRQMQSFFVSAHGSPATKDVLLARIAANHGIAPQDMVMVGDSQTDLAGAEAHGIPFIGVVPPSALNPFPPTTVVIADLTELSLALRRRGCTL